MALHYSPVFSGTYSVKIGSYSAYIGGGTVGVTTDHGTYSATYSVGNGGAYINYGGHVYSVYTGYAGYTYSSGTYANYGGYATYTAGAYSGYATAYAAGGYPGYAGYHYYTAVH